MDTFVGALRPGCFMAGLDIKDCFFHWSIHSSSRRKLGIRHPITGQRGVYLFLPPGLSSAPGHNEEYVGVVVLAASRGLDITVARFVDDLRIVNSKKLDPLDDEKVLNLHLECLKHNLEELGVKVHTKTGKYIAATQSIEWLGWRIDSVSLRVWLTPAKYAKGLQLCQQLLDAHFKGERITAKQVMSTAGFLNFLSTVLKQSRPYLRSLYQCLARGQVFAAWQRGERRHDPEVKLSDQAAEDLSWWCVALLRPMYRALHVVGDTVSIWHQKHPDLSALRQLA